MKPLQVLFQTKVLSVGVDRDPQTRKIFSVNVELQDINFPHRRIVAVTKDLEPHWHVGQKVEVFLCNNALDEPFRPNREKHLIHLQGVPNYIGVGKFDLFNADFIDDQSLTTFSVESSADEWTNDLDITGEYYLWLNAEL